MFQFGTKGANCLILWFSICPQVRFVGLISCAMWRRSNYNDNNIAMFSIVPVSTCILIKACNMCISVVVPYSALAPGLRGLSPWQKVYFGEVFSVFQFRFFSFWVSNTCGTQELNRKNPRSSEHSTTSTNCWIGGVVSVRILFQASQICLSKV